MGASLCDLAAATRSLLKYPLLRAAAICSSTSTTTITPSTINTLPSMSDNCRNRLAEQRKLWRKDHPFGFYARPVKAADGSLDLLTWEAGVPGKEETPWEGGLYKLQLTFPNEYPTKPPKCKFTLPIFHPNVYPSGRFCLSILNEYRGWKPAISIREVLMGIQHLLDDPNTASAANDQAGQLYEYNIAEYNKRIRLQANQMAINKQM